MNLFDQDYIVGVFRGFSESGMEFHADLVMPYRDDFQSMPMHGMFVVVQLEHDREAIFGRITTIAAQGRLVSPIGEDYAVRAVRDQREIPDELRSQYLKYKVNIRVLGVLRHEGSKLIFVPSHRRLPHVGAPVAFLSPEVLADVANANDAHPDAASIGHLAFGEFVYCAGDSDASVDAWIEQKSPTIRPKFQIKKLTSRRSFVFARAGFGKSNLVKLLFSTLYSTDGGPTVPRRGDRKDPVGTVIFDPDGEYFWPDVKGNRALCDVPELSDRLVIFTNRKAPSPTYESFVVSGVKLDIRQLPAARVIGVALAADKQEQQNVAKLKNLNPTRWADLVDLVSTTPSGELYANPVVFSKILGLSGDQAGEQNAAISNMVRVVKDLHDPSSLLLRALKEALQDGKLCVVDISQMRGQQGLKLAGIILSDIFAHNQEQFTAKQPRTIPTIAVFEEAQSMLGGSGTREDGPFVEWVKEGRKYDLGSFMITQQPGSIPQELLSQGDNFFVFHLLSQGDLLALKKANAHFSDDLLSTLLNEPLVGHGVFWSSAPNSEGDIQPYPLPVRVLDFNKTCELRDPGYGGPLLSETYAARMRASYIEAAEEAARFAADVEQAWTGEHQSVERTTIAEGGRDVEQTFKQSAIERLRADNDFQKQIRSHKGIPWGAVVGKLKEFAPPGEPNKQKWAYRLVEPAITKLFGVQDQDWATERRGEKDTLCIYLLSGPAADQADNSEFPTDDKPPF